MAKPDAKPSGRKENLMQAIDLLTIISHPVRLSILCNLFHAGEMTVSALLAAEDGAVSQPQMSQFLAMMRDKGLVATRREGQSVHYRLSSPEAGRVIAALYETYCAKA